MKKIVMSLSLAFLAAFADQAAAQPRPIEKPTSSSQSEEAKPAPAPPQFEAKYEGGLFGFSEKQGGTLNFDDINERLVFRNKENKEVFAFPYKSILVIYPDSRKYTPTAAAVGSMIPVPGAGLLGLIKGKNPYLVVQFDDPDSKVGGVTSFKLDNKELLKSVLYTLGEKAELKQRGDAFYRPKSSTQTL